MSTLTQVARQTQKEIKYFIGLIGLMVLTADGLDLIIREKNAMRFILGLQKEIMKSR